MYDRESDPNWPKVPREVFDGLAVFDCARVFGVDYARLVEPDGGELYLTRYGWTLTEHLRPAAWYNDHQYAERGKKLPGGTGAVYRVPTVGRRGRKVDLVVKFNRFAQDVPLVISTFPRRMSEAELAGVAFNSPFEEFGLLRELRRGLMGPPGLRIRTKRALGIYCPPEHHAAWRLGRSRSGLSRYSRHQARDQVGGDFSPIELFADREYVTLFGYIEGENAEELYDKGVLTEQQLNDMTERVARELALKGFRVLDHKPKHFIMRRRRNGELLQRNGEFAYALVDFELLQRTNEYLEHAAARQERDA